MAQDVVEVNQEHLEVRLRSDQLLVRLHWEFATDLDLAALCVERPRNTARLVYHAARGARGAAPWAKLTAESDGEGRSKSRFETLVITRASAHEEIHLFVWDHDAVVGGEAAPFAAFPESYGVSVIERNNRQIKLGTSKHDGVNCLAVGSILAGERLVHHHQAARLEKPECKLDALMELIT